MTDHKQGEASFLTYDFRIIHKAGKDNPTDYVFHLPVTDLGSKDRRPREVSGQYINFIIYNVIPTAMKLV